MTCEVPGCFWEAEAIFLNGQKVDTPDRPYPGMMIECKDPASSTVKVYCAVHWRNIALTSKPLTIAVRKA